MNYREAGAPYSAAATRFLPAKLATYLTDRGISERAAKKAGVRILGRHETQTLFPGSMADGAVPEAALLLPISDDYAVVRVVYQPEHEGPKFLCPGGQPLQVYQPPGGKNDASGPVYVVEGPFKALAVATAGVRNVLGITGVHGWHNAGTRELHPELAAELNPGREVIFAPDADVASNRQVAVASLEFLRAVEAAGCTGKLLQLPDLGDGKSGADDFIAAKGAKAFRALPAVGLHDSALASVQCLTLPFDEPGVAARFALKHAGEVGHATRDKVTSWWLFDGARWKADDGAINERVAGVVRGLVDEARAAHGDEGKACRRMAAALQRASTVRNAVFLASCDPALRIDPDKFDAAPELLGVRNGTLDLATGALRPGAREDFITKCAGAGFQPKAGAARWHKFITWVTQGDASLARFLQQLAGSCLLAYTGRREIVFLYGEGANGKSVFIEVLLELLGDYGAATRSEIIMKMRDSTNAERATPFLAVLPGLRLVVASETAEGHAIDDATIKDMTGGDRISTRANYSAPRQFRPSFRLLVRTNNLPNVRATDKGARDRILVVPFAATITERDDDKMLRERIVAEELPGVLTWAMEGLRQWRANGYRFDVPRCVELATARALRDADVTGRWLADNIILDPAQRTGDFRTPQKELTENYLQWCRENNFQPKSARGLWDYMRRHHGLEAFPSNGEHIVVGVSINAGRHADQAVARRVASNPAATVVQLQPRRAVPQVSQKAQADFPGKKG